MDRAEARIGCKTTGCQNDAFCGTDIERFALSFGHNTECSAFIKLFTNDLDQLCIGHDINAKFFGFCGKHADKTCSLRFSGKVRTRPQGSVNLHDVRTELKTHAFEPMQRAQSVRAKNADQLRIGTAVTSRQSLFDMFFDTVFDTLFFLTFRVDGVEVATGNHCVAADES